MDLKTALTQLVVTDDGHWTEDGAPRLDVLSQMTGAEVTRDQILALDPHFSRNTAEVAGPAPAPKGPDPDGETLSKDPAETEEVQPGSDGGADPNNAGGGGDGVLPGDAAPVTPPADDDVPLVGNPIAAQPIRSTEDLAEMEALGERLAAGVVDARKAMDEAKADYDRAVAAHDKWMIQMEGEREPPHIVNQRNLQAAIKASHDQRAAKVAQNRKVMEHFGSVQAPIDAAMQRPTGRGGKRPERPLKKRQG
jgi:hypothetical protein